MNTAGRFQQQSQRIGAELMIVSLVTVSAGRDVSGVQTSPPVGMGWGVPMAEGTLTISGLEVWPQTGRPSILLVTGPWPTPFWFATATLIQKTGHLLRHCHCGRVFLRNAPPGVLHARLWPAGTVPEVLQSQPRRTSRASYQEYAKLRRRTQPRAKVARRKRSH